MGMYYWAEIVVGLPYEEVDDEFKEKVMDEQYHPVQDLSPFYDGGGEGLFGITIRCSGDFCWTEIEDLGDLDCDIESAKRDFTLLTGLKPRVYLTTRGS